MTVILQFGYHPKGWLNTHSQMLNQSDLQHWSPPLTKMGSEPKSWMMELSPLGLPYSTLQVRSPDSDSILAGKHWTPGRQSAHQSKTSTLCERVIPRFSGVLRWLGRENLCSLICLTDDIRLWHSSRLFWTILFSISSLVMTLAYNFVVYHSLLADINRDCCLFRSTLESYTNHCSI